MGRKTGISWTDHTFNPWLGCTKVSPGCANCYAEVASKRMGRDVWGKTGNRDVTKGRWRDVLKWNRVAQVRGAIDLVFCASMCDVFEGPETMSKAAWRIIKDTKPRLWSLIRECTSLHFQVLTKRPERIQEELPADWGDGWPHVWLGTTIENMDMAGRADHLRRVPAVVRFISYEPALGPLTGLDLAGIDWVIYGGESGGKRRPEDKQWARDMRDHCAAKRIAFFHKQSSAGRPGQGIELDGRVIKEYPTPRGLTVSQFQEARNRSTASKSLVHAKQHTVSGTDTENARRLGADVDIDQAIQNINRIYSDSRHRLEDYLVKTFFAGDIVNYKDGGRSSEGYVNLMNRRDELQMGYSTITLILRCAKQRQAFIEAGEGDTINALSWSHQARLLAVPKDQRLKVARKAVKEKWTLRQMADKIKAYRTRRELEVTPNRALSLIGSVGSVLARVEGKASDFINAVKMLPEGEKATVARQLAEQLKLLQRLQRALE